MPNTDQSINDSGIPTLSFTVTPSTVVQAPVDDTLSIAGEAADAKAVGDAVADLSADISDNSEDIAAIKNWTGEDIKVNSESDDSIAKAIDDLNDSILGSAYPVGSIYMSISDTVPDFEGTWQEIVISHSLVQLKNGGANYEPGTGTGTVHYWLRTA